MPFWKALFLGIVQGLTEFFPVSSSAHLKLAKLFLGISEKDNVVVFDLVCHLGTLMAVLYFFREEIQKIMRFPSDRLGQLTLGTLPLLPFYFLLKPLREWASQTSLLGIFLGVTAMILFAGHWCMKKNRSFFPRSRAKDSLLIGSAQALALIPGVSRSAATVCSACALGWPIREAVRFSFLLSIPAVMGGSCIEIYKALKTPEILSSSYCGISCYLLGFFSSGLAGLATIRYALRIWEKGDFRPFAWYCIAIGSFATLYMNCIP